MSAALSPTFPTSVGTVTGKFFFLDHLDPFLLMFLPNNNFMYLVLIVFLKPVSPLIQAKSGKNRTFSNLLGLNLCTSDILVSGCLRGQDVVGSTVSEKIPGTKITRYYLRRHLYWHCVISSRRHLCPTPPKTFERKLCRLWLKEPLRKI